MQIKTGALVKHQMPPQKIRILACRMLFRGIVCRINVRAREAVRKHAWARTQL